MQAGIDSKRKTSILEKFLLPNPDWQEGYKSFHRLMGSPMGWLFVADDGHMLSLGRRKNSYSSFSSSHSCEAFIQKYMQQLSEDEDRLSKLPSFYRCTCGRNGAVFPIKHLGRLKGLVVLCSFKRSESQVSEWLEPFDHFLQAHVELAYKGFELNNFYETVHPRALALSTIHSVHRVISASLRLSELLPRIGRLSAQVLKAKGCSIMLMDEDKDALVPAFSFGADSRLIHKNKVRLGKGIEGKIAHTGEFYLSRSVIGLPFIEEDIVGTILLWDKVDGKAFSRTDLEILKSLSEQAVVAIKNAQLFEETEKLTLGSIKTIHEILNMNFGATSKQHPLFGKIVMEVGREMELSGREQTHLERAVMLLRTGWLGFPEHLLQKKGKLTKKEFAKVKQIPLRGASILSSISSLQPVIPIILHQHERYDGKGYPRGLRGEEIPVGARIVCVINSFIAMISKRSYRESLTVEDAFEEIRNNQETQFDPKVVEAFMKVIRRKDILDELHFFTLSHKNGKIELQENGRIRKKS